MALISVVVPCFNAADTLCASLDSIRHQSCVDFECLIVDDCSADRSLELIERYVGIDSRFKLFCQPQNLGVSAARNLALSKASGQYIAFLDADDLWLPDFLELSVNAHRLYRCGLVHSPYWRFVSDGDGYKVAPVSPPLFVDSRNVLQKNHIPLLTAVLDRDLVGCFKFPAVRPEDYAVWCELLMQDKGLSSRSTGVSLAYYRVSPKQRSSNKFKAVKRLYSFYADYLGYPVSSASALTARWLFINLMQRTSSYGSALGVRAEELRLMNA